METEMAQDLLGSMYNDFFGPGSGGDGKPPVFNDPKKQKEIEAQVEMDFKNEADRSSEKPSGIGTGSQAGAGAAFSGDADAMKKADDALREAKALFATSTGDKKEKEENEQEEKEPEPETDPMEDLESLIGLTSIKHDVKELADFVKVQKMRSDAGMKAVPVSLHLVFTGNPGTGKTTVARIISRIYKQIGVLSKGQLVEVDRSGLVAGYVGQTALKTQAKIKEALGGVLFIDEAYSLAQDNDNFGQEAIDTILKAMEDHRDDLVVIVAGYTKPMEKFIDSNPGLKSRFNKYIEFPDYSIDELESIFDISCNKYEYNLDEDVKKHVREMISQRKLERIENFANAREVRNLFEEIVTNQATRIAKMENPTPEDIKVVKLEDLMDKKPEAEEAKKDDAEKDSTSEEATKEETTTENTEVKEEAESQDEE